MKGDVLCLLFILLHNNSIIIIIENWDLQFGRTGS